MDNFELTAGTPEGTKRRSIRDLSNVRESLVRSGLIAVLLVLIIFCSSNEMIAQTGTVNGDVTDALTGEPISGVSLGLQESSRKTTTDADGRFTLRGIPTGSHTLKVAHAGYAIQEVILTVSEGERLTRHLELFPAYSPEGADDFQIARRRGQGRALNRQWEPVNIKSVISSEQMNQFGDYTVKKAMVRVPGVQVSNDGEVNLRGVGHHRYGVTVDGLRMGSTGTEDRGIDLGSISTDIVRELEVIKVLTPDMEADALAGTINLVTHRLAGEQRQIDALLGGGADAQYFGHTGLGSRASLNYAEKLRDDFSIAVNLSHQRDDTGWESLGIDYDVADFGSGPVDVIERVSPGLNTDRQNRISGGVQLTYQPSDQTSYQLRGMINNNDRWMNRHMYSWSAGGDWIDPGTTGAQGEQGSYRYDFNARDINVQQYAFQAGARHYLNRFNLEYGAGWSQGSYSQEMRTVPFITGSRNMNIEMENRNRPIMQVIGSRVQMQDMLISLMNREVDEQIENNFLGRVDIEIPIYPGSLKFGSSFRGIHKDRGFKNVDLTAVGGLRLSGFDLAGVKEHDVTGQYHMPWLLDEEMTMEFFDTGLPVFRKDEHLQRERSNIRNFDATELIYSGYGMTTLEFGRIMFLGGVRVEHTVAEYHGKHVELNFLGRHDTTFVNSTNRDYTYLFPNAQVKFATGQWSNVRMAYSRSIHRADFNVLVPYQMSIVRDSTLFRGNPDLNPMISDNLDLQFEHYFSSIGGFSIGLFHKRLSEGFIYELQRIVEEGEFTEYQERTFRNSEETATVYGLEVSWQQNLVYLPGFLGNLSTFANYTWSNSLFKSMSRADDVALPYQSPHVINAALDYTQGRFSTMLSYHWTDVSINRLQKTTGFAPSIDHNGSLYLDQYQDGWTDVSVSMMYRMTREFRLWVDVFNLLGSERVEYIHTPDTYPIEVDFRRGREFRIGIRYYL